MGEAVGGGGDKGGRVAPHLGVDQIARVIGRSRAVAMPCAGVALDGGVVRGGIARHFDGSKFAQVVRQHGFIARADVVIQGVAARDDDHAPRFGGGAVGGGEQAGLGADGHGHMHLAALGRHAVRRPIVRHRAVAHLVAQARGCRKLAADRAGRDLGQPVFRRAALHNITVGQPFLLMNFAHEGLPQLGGGRAARGLGRERLIVVMPDPDRGAVPARHAGEEHALLVAVRACLARNGLAGNAGGLARAGGHDILQNIHGQPCGGCLEHLTARLVRVRVIEDIVVAVRQPQEGNGLLVHTAVAQSPERDRHFDARKPAGAERQAERGLVDMLLACAQAKQIVIRAIHAHIVHQRIRGGGVVALGERRAQCFRPAVAAAAVIARPCVLPVIAAPARDGDGHIIQYRPRARAQLDGGSVDGDGLDGRADGHVHIRSAV